MASHTLLHSLSVYPVITFTWKQWMTFAAACVVKKEAIIIVAVK